jgi:hypothetical protein
LALVVAFVVALLAIRFFIIIFKNTVQGFWFLPDHPWDCYAYPSSLQALVTRE